MTLLIDVDSRLNISEVLGAASASASESFGAGDEERGIVNDQYDKINMD